MRKGTTLNVRVQQPEDLIDFPVSDTFRDLYAAQQLTYPSGRYSRLTAQSQHGGSLEPREGLEAARLEISIWQSKAMRLKQERDDWKSRAMYLEAQLAKLEQDPKHSNRHTQSKEGPSTAFEPVVVGG